MRFDERDFYFCLQNVLELLNLAFNFFMLCKVC